ncbi:hypothetical protein SDJN02_03968, partial [Cucurbita argyrosperma subsp. argyrosperma]
MALAMALRRLSSSIDRPVRHLLHGGSFCYLSSLPNEAVYDKERPRVPWPKQLNDPLEVIDPEIANIIELEKARQWKDEAVEKWWPSSRERAICQVCKF